MAMEKPYNGLPEIYYPGTEDNSGRAIPSVKKNLPIEIPLVFTFAPKGSKKGGLYYADEALKHFGDIFDLRSKFTTLSTPFAKLHSKYNLPMFIQRVIPEDAGPEANICLALEVISTNKLREIERDQFGEYRYENGVKIQSVNEIDGVIARWVVLDNPGGKLGIQTKKTGNMKYDNDPSVESVIYPIMDFKAPWVGSYGNNIGIQIEAPNKKTHQLNDLKLTQMVENKSFIYRFSLFRRENERKSGKVVKTQMAENGFNFTFKEGTYDSKAGGASLDLNEILIDQYSDLDTRGGRKPVYGDIGDFFIYHDNIEEVTKLMAEKEKASGNQAFANLDVENDHHLINFVTGCDESGKPYKAIYIQDHLDLGVRYALGVNNILYLRGGSDGTMNNKVFDDLVREQLLNFGDLDTHYTEMGECPFQQIYDVGYSSETKQAMFYPLSKRPDINISVSPTDLVTNPGRQLPASEQSSIASALASMARNYPESKVFGTKVMRVVIYPESAYLIDSPAYKKLVPCTYDLAEKRAIYFGDPRGPVENRGYDQGDYKNVNSMKGISNTFQPDKLRMTNWDNGMTYMKKSSDTQVFVPAVRTVYLDETSVLTSDINMQIICAINKMLFQSWCVAVGNAKDTQPIFNRNVEDDIAGRIKSVNNFDNRIRAVVEVFQTPAQEAKGYEWSTRVKTYMNNQRTLNEAWTSVFRRGEYNE